MTDHPTAKNSPVRRSLIVVAAAFFALTLGMGATASAAPVTDDVITPACAPGGPYHEGDDAVWHNCDGTIDRIKVRQYFPYSNYEVCVAPYSDHRNPWWRTIDMSLIHDGYC